MGTGLIFPGQWDGDEWRELCGLTGLAVRRSCSRKQPPLETVPETDTGGLVEYTEALERTALKELGKMPP